MKIDQIMTRRVVSVDIDDTLETLREVFQNVRFRHVVVLEERQMVGVISDRDLLLELTPTVDTDYATARDRSILKKRCHQIMSRKPVTIQPHEDVRRAARIFVKHDLSCLPVMGPEGEVLGIITPIDILKMVYQAEPVS